MGVLWLLFVAAGVVTAAGLAWSLLILLDSYAIEDWHE
jgi:hypothetical protein